MASQRPLLVLVLCCSSVHATESSSTSAEVVLADAGNTCPDGYSKITSLRACLAALDVLGPGGAEEGGVPPAVTGYDFGGEEDADWPSGCYNCSDAPDCGDGAWFNTHATGAANAGATPICARGLEPLATGQVLFMGDSDVDYWATARGLSPGSHNVGVGGYTCVDVLREVEGMLQAFAPTVLVLVCGENDIQGDNATAQAAFSSFEEIVSRVTATSARVIVMTTKNEPSTSEYWDSHAAYDALLMDLARSLNGSLAVVDVNTGFQALGNPISLFASDELHLSTEGYSHWDAWATLALQDATCLVWQAGECTETVGGGSTGENDQGSSVVLADAGNTCPDDYSKITSWRACLAALDVLGPGGAEVVVPPAVTGYDFGGEEDFADWPSGCYHYHCINVTDCTDGSFFNTHATGAAEDGATPICARGLEPLVTGQVLFMGDSDVDYWATARGLSSGSHNVGVGGYTCVDVLSEVDGMLQAFAPTVLVLVCGENDIQGDDATAQLAFSSFEEIVSRVTATSARVIVMTTKNEPSTSEYWDTHAAYDALLMDLARSLNGPLAVVDVNTGFQALGNPISLFASDELHLSTEGYSHWDAWATLALQDATCLVWQEGECTETVVADVADATPTPTPTPTPPPTVSFTATLSSATFDHTNSDHRDGFNAGVAATMQGVSAADVSTAFAQQRRLSAGARRLPGSYEAAITVTVPAGVNREDVATAISGGTFTSALATSLNTELGISDVAVSAVTAPVTVTPAPASNDSSSNPAVNQATPPAATSALIVVGAMALVWWEL